MVEPNPARRNHLRVLITDWGHTAVCFEKESICLDNLPLLLPELIILGQLPLGRIYRFLYAAKHIYFSLPVLAITGEPDFHEFIRINGFVHTKGITPAFTPEDLKARIHHFKETTKGSSAFSDLKDWPMIVGIESELVKLKKAIFEIARSGESLLIEGENGTGKDLVARAVHYWSVGDQGIFIKVDSGAVTRDILQHDLSKWFDASEDAPAPSPRTIFLDEIGQMPMDLQRILLRLFEQQEFSDNPGFRIIAANSENLGRLTEMGKFRKDLYYRLNVFRIKIPPLRKRRQDIPLLVDFFMDKYCRELGKGHYQLPVKARGLYGEYDWPGNVREIENVVKSSVIVGDECGFIESLCRCYNNHRPAGGGQKDNLYGLVDVADLKSYMGDLNNISLKNICREFITRAEKKLMKKALDATKWNRKKAAGLLNISYKSLLNKIKVYNLTVER